MKTILFRLFIVCLLYLGVTSTRVMAVSQVCDTISPLQGTTNDASGLIQACINAAQPNDTVELPVGKYFVAHQIKIEKPLTLRTQGVNDTAPRCSNRINNCANLIATSNFDGFPGILLINQNDTTIDHLVIDGNKEARSGSSSASNCRSGNNGWGFNMRAHVANFKFTNSINKNALCGTGLEMSGSNAKILNNLFISNGVHDAYLMWADGLTVHDCTGCTFEKNDFVDGTDIDAIFGGCTQCSIQYNTIRHTDSFSGAAFAGLMLHAWPSTSGNYTDTVVANNTIDCGAKRRCGFALYLGAHGWYQTMSYGGSIHDNTIINAQAGLVIDDFYNAEVYNNRVSNMFGNSYTIGTASHHIDQTKDTIGTVFSSVNWDGTIPYMSCPDDCSIPQKNASFIRQSIPSPMFAGQTYPATVSMNNTGSTEWTKTTGFALQPYDSGSSGFWGMQKVELAPDETIGIVDDTTKEFSFTITAPSAPGTYPLQWRMTNGGSNWFGDPTPRMSILVLPARLPADINADGKIDIFDYNILVAQYGKTGTNTADINGDGKVDIYDYNALVTDFGR
ncbi:MAG: dockerin type I domain-containing protein [Patescibacteria group bacterium]